MTGSHLRTGLIAGGSLLAIALVLLLVGSVVRFLNANAEAIRWWFVFGFLLIVYLFPSFVAAGRKHRSGGAICALNLLFGWTVLGWCFALIWSLTGNTD